VAVCDRQRLNGPGPVIGPLVLLLAALAAAGCGKQEPVVKIGFVAPLTGDQAPHGQDMLHGAELAIEHAAAEGQTLAGHTLVLVPLDDQRSPTQAVAAAKKLVADPDVAAVVGHLNSSCTMPASAIYHQARVLHISPISSNPQISRQGFDTFHRICATDDLQGPGAASFATQCPPMDVSGVPPESFGLCAKRIFILDDMTTYGRGLANEFEKKLTAMGIAPLGHEGITQGDKDFTPLLTKIKALQPDLIYFAGMFPEAALLIKQRMEVGVSGKFMSGDGSYDPVLIELATPQAAEGVFLTTIGSDIRQLPTAQGFVRAYEAAYGPIGAYSAYAYEATRLAVWAIRTAGTKDRPAVLAAMKSLKDWPGLFGLQNFDEKGDTLIRDIGIFTVKQGAFQFVRTATWD
jgi:branched-chain amino acid transport system substrate-binding protein